MTNAVAPWMAESATSTGHRFPADAIYPADGEDTNVIELSKLLDLETAVGPQ